jgi:DNA repair protein RadC
MKPLTVCSEIQVTYRPAISNKPIVKSALDAYVVLNEFFPDDLIGLKEMFVVGYLNRSNRVIGVYEVSSGGITGTVADIRLILGTALKIAATGIIIAHNHPSGNLEPSNTDLMLTRKIKEAALYFDIQLLDHLILTWENKYSSMADSGKI